MKTCRMDILKELLFELDAICKEHNLKYTVTDAAAETIHEKGEFPEQFDYLTVAMTGGDIERFIEIVNRNDNKHRQVEYFLNNPYARGFQIRYCNNDTTLVNVKEFGNHINYGMYIRIKPIERILEKNVSTKIFQFCRKAWVGSTKRIRSCNWKRFLPVVILKSGVSIVGRKNVSRFLYQYNKKLRFIDRWEDIEKYEKVHIGRAVFTKEADWNIKETVVNGKTVSVTEAVLCRNIDGNPSHATVITNDIEETMVPFDIMLNQEMVGLLKKMQKERDGYLKIVTKANRPAKVMDKAWNTYLMTRDVLNFKDEFNEEKIKKVEAIIREKDYEAYKEEMQAYLAASRRWRKRNVPFLGNEEAEKLIADAKEAFKDVIGEKL